MMPVLFKIGPFPVHSWGLLLMIGFLLATWRAARNAYRYSNTTGADKPGLQAEDVWDIALWSLLGGIIGARLVFVLLNLQTYLANPAGIFQVWTGGMTFYGGLFGGILAGGLACRQKGVNMADFGDLAALSLPIGYAFGRVGCFLNGCCYGGVCDAPWAVNFAWEDGVIHPSHPAQIYAIFASVATYFLLLPLERNRKFRGQIILAYIVLYAIYRFGIEFVRIGATADYAGMSGLTQAQIASLIFAIGASVAFVVLGRRSSITPRSTAAIP